MFAFGLAAILVLGFGIGGVPSLLVSLSHGSYADRSSLTPATLTIPAVTVGCTPTELLGSGTVTCDVSVVGDAPTGVVEWSAAALNGPPLGSFSPTTCTLSAGNCSVTWNSGTPAACSGTPLGANVCASIVFILATYDGDAQNERYNGYTTVSLLAPLDAYSAEGSAAAGVPGSSGQSGGPSGSYGTETVSEDVHASGWVSDGENALATSADVSVMGDAKDGEVAASAAGTNGGNGVGYVSIAGLVVVTGACSLPTNPDPSNLIPCLQFSVSEEGSASAGCHGSPDDDCGLADAWALTDFAACDLNAEAVAESLYGQAVSIACAQGDAFGEACDSSSEPDPCTDSQELTYPCPSEDTEDDNYACGDSATAITFSGSSTDETIPESNVVATTSGDTLAVYADTSANVFTTVNGTAALTLDPTITIHNLDPSTLTVGPLSGEIVASSTPSSLALASTLEPSPALPGQSVEDQTVLTNTGTLPLSDVNATGSMDGPLVCPSANLPAGGQETCTGSFTAQGAGDQTDYIVANGTETDLVEYNGTLVDLGTIDVDNGTSAVFSVAPPRTYQVAFTEAGLPAGAEWWLNASGGESQASTGSTISFDEPNGSYTYTVATTNKQFHAAGGAFTVAGDPVSEAVTFARQTFTVTFSESGALTKGQAKTFARKGWTVVLNGTAQHTTTSAISFSGIPNGTLPVLITGPSGFRATGSGTVEVAGTTSVAVTISKGSTYALTFKETGLKHHPRWCATLDGFQVCTTKATLRFSNLTAGSYTYTVGTATGYTVSPASGTIGLTGSSKVLLKFTRG